MKKEIINEIINITLTLIIVVISIPIWEKVEKNIIESHNIYDSYLEIVKDM